MSNTLLNCAFILALTVSVPVEQPIACEKNEIPSTMTLIYDTVKVAWTAIMEQEPTVLVAPIMQDSGQGWEPMTIKTDCTCRNYDYVLLVCKDKNRPINC